MSLPQWKSLHTLFRCVFRKRVNAGENYRRKQRITAWDHVDSLLFSSHPAALMPADPTAERVACISWSHFLDSPRLLAMLNLGSVRTWFLWVEGYPQHQSQDNTHLLSFSLLEWRREVFLILWGPDSGAFSPSSGSLFSCPKLGASENQATY